MGRFVNPDNRAFQAALNSKIYHLIFKWVISVCKSDFLHCELTRQAHQLNGSSASGSITGSLHSVFMIMLSETVS